MEKTFTHPLNHWDYMRGWEHTCPGWYEINFHPYTLQKHVDMIEWMYKTLDNPEKHCRWRYSTPESGVKFRYERDYILFRLTWE